MIGLLRTVSSEKPSISFSNPATVPHLSQISGLRSISTNLNVLRSISVVGEEGLINISYHVYLK